MIVQETEFWIQHMMTQLYKTPTLPTHGYNVELASFDVDRTYTYNHTSVSINDNYIETPTTIFMKFSQA